jgi:hypothetical protein
LVYPFSKENTHNIAYHFDFDYLDKREPLYYMEKVIYAVSDWKRLWTNIPPSLNSFYVGNMILIYDTRPSSIQKFQILSDETAFVFALCDSIHNIESIYVRTKEKFSLPINQIMEIIKSLVNNNLMITNNNYYLSLATSINNNSIN